MHFGRGLIKSLRTLWHIPSFLDSRLEAITIRLEAIAIRLEAITIRLEAIAIRLEAITIWEAMAIRLEALIHVHVSLANLRCLSLSAPRPCGPRGLLTRPNPRGSLGVTAAEEEEKSSDPWCPCWAVSCRAYQCFVLFIRYTHTVPLGLSYYQEQWTMMVRLGCRPF